MNLCGSLSRIRRIARHYRGSTLAVKAEKGAAGETSQVYTDDQVDTLLDQLFDQSQRSATLFAKAQYRTIEKAGIVDATLFEPFKEHQAAYKQEAKRHDYSTSTGFCLTQLNELSPPAPEPPLEDHETGNLKFLKSRNDERMSSMVSNSKLSSTLPMWRFERNSLPRKTHTQYQAEVERLLKQCAIYVNDLTPLLDFPALRIDQHHQRNARHWQTQWIEWWHRILSEVIMIAEDRQGGDPSFELIRDRAVQFKLFDHALDGTSLPHLDFRRLNLDLLDPLFAAHARVDNSPPNQMFVDDHLGLLNDHNLRSASARMAKCERAPRGLVYMTHALGLNIFSPVAFYLDQQATFIVVYESEEEAKKAISNAPNDFGVVLEHSGHKYTSSDWDIEQRNETIDVANYFDSLGYELATSLDDARFGPGKTRMTTQMLTEQDWKRHLRRRDILRLADPEQRQSSDIDEEKVHYQFYLQRNKTLDYDQLDLNRPHRTEFFIDQNADKNVIHRQLQRNHSVAIDLLNVVAEMLVANNYFNVTRDAVGETVFLDLMRHMSADIVGFGLNDRDRKREMKKN